MLALFTVSRMLVSEGAAMDSHGYKILEEALGDTAGICTYVGEGEDVRFISVQGSVLSRTPGTSRPSSVELPSETLNRLERAGLLAPAVGEVVVGKPQLKPLFCHPLANDEMPVLVLEDLNYSR